MGRDEGGNRAVMIVLAYLPPFAVIPLLVERDDPEVVWHAKNGIVLAVGEMLVLLVLVVILIVVGLMTAGVGCILFPILALPVLAFVAVHLLAVMRAFNGKRLVIPLVSEYADRF